MIRVFLKFNKIYLETPDERCGDGCYIRYLLSPNEAKELFDSLITINASQQPDTADAKYPCGCYPNADKVIRGKNQCLCGMRR